MLKLGNASTGDVTADGGRAQSVPTVRLSPQTRSDPLASQALPALRASAIEPFLAEPLIVDAAVFAAAPRIVSAQEGRVLLSRGDRAYARRAKRRAARRCCRQPGPVSGVSQRHRAQRPRYR